MAEEPVHNEKACEPQNFRFWLPLKKRLSSELQEDIYRKIYHDNNIEEEEKTLLTNFQVLSTQNCVSTPESDGFITATSSPTDNNKNEFFDATEHLETPIYLEKELEEQDHLSSLFQSITNKSKVKDNSEQHLNHVRSAPQIASKTAGSLLKRLQSATFSDMDSGLETGSSEASGMELSDPLQNFGIEQLTTKEQRSINEHDSSSSDTTDDFQDFGKNVKNELVTMQTKEQKQKQNEEIVIMESSSVSSETGSWESVFPRGPTFSKSYSPCDESSEMNLTKPTDKITRNTANGHSNHYFIDASSLNDENEFCSLTAMPPSTSNPYKYSTNKLTKVKVNELADSQKYEVAEFQKEIKVFENVTSKYDTIVKSEPVFTWVASDCASTSAAPCTAILNTDMTASLSDSTENSKSEENKISDEKITLEVEDLSLDVTTVANIVLKEDEDKVVTDTCDNNNYSFEAEQSKAECSINASSTEIKDESKFENDTQKPTFIRSNTFELEKEDDQLTLIRQNNERRQGSLLFQNSIQQYSGHNLSVDELIPATPHNSIIQINDSIIIDQSTDRPLDSLFKSSNSVIESVHQDTTETDVDIEIEPTSICTIKREESVPIISGGVSSQDYELVRKESPLSRRKIDSIPIVCGGITVLDQPEPKIEKPQKINATTAWVVDMKPAETTTQKQEDPEVEEKSPQPKSNKSSLGFYVDLNEIPNNKDEETSLQTNETSLDSTESVTDKKNIFSMFIDFEAPKKSMPSRLSQSLYCKKIEKQSTSKAPECVMSLSTTNIENEKPSDAKPSEETPKDKSLYMFIESDTNVVRRRRSSSNNRAHNRHSWNSSGESDTSTLCHQRTYSLSGEGSIELDQKPLQEIETISHVKEKKVVETSSSSDENKESSSLAENEDQAVEVKKMEVITEVKETSSSGFVRLSDLDKPVPKIISTEVEHTVSTRMSRSIPETSWIENKLLMSRSTGCRTSTSRLFPHLSASTPSSVYMTQGRSKSPGQDTDELVSELSDMSSMHSSTAFEVSTEETSSSYQPHRSTDRLGHDLLRMFLEEISPDVTVEVGGRRLKAHKCILSSRCQYFAAMLSGGWVESAGNVISLQGFSYQAVHFAMCHIYSGAADIPDTISLVELATLADMLGLEGLKEVVAYTLKLKHCHLFHKPCTICVVGVLECLPLAAAYGLDELYRKALRWITRYFVRVWPTRAFAMLPSELMEKCYQQHVVHMSADNVLETTLCCDKLLATLPSVRWAEVIHQLASQLADACQQYITQHFSSVLASASFLSLGKELSWNISRLEDGLFRAAERLAPEQACRSYARVHRLLGLLETGDECWSPNFVDLVRKLLARVEDCVVRQAVRVSYTSSWPRLDPVLRARVQELCCLPLDRPRVSRQSRSTSGSRNLDLRQVRLAMQQHSRRTQSTDSRPSTAHSAKPTVKTIVEPPRPRTWPAQVTTKPKIISSSESSRTSSPAMKRTAKKLETTRTQIKNATNDMSLDSLASPVTSKTKIIFNKKKVETKMSTDSLASAKSDKTKAKSKIEPVVKPKLRTTTTQTKTKSTSNILKSNVQKTVVEKATLSKSMPVMNKENRTLPGKQSKSGSSSSTQHSPSALLKNRQTNTSSPISLPRNTMSPYNGSPSLRRSLLLAARTPQVPVKPVSPATNKRLARIQSASQSVTSPTKSSAAKCVSNTTRAKSVQQRSVTKLPAKKQPDKVAVERSGTFLKDEPTVLNKNKAMSSDQKNGKRRAIFNKDEILCMLNVWADENIQNKFKTMRHTIVWEQISTTLVVAGYKKRSGCEIKCKINNLKAEYKRLKAISINALTSWPYFNILHEILGHRDIYNPNSVDDSLDTSKSITNHSETSDCKSAAGCSWMDVETHVKRTSSISPTSMLPTLEVETGTEVPVTTTPATSTVAPITSTTTTPTSTTAASRRSRRPPRRHGTKENKLIETLINVEKRYVERLVAIEEREKKIEERENRVADSMCRFFDTLTQFLTQSPVPTFTPATPSFVPVTPNKSTSSPSASTDSSRSPTPNHDIASSPISNSKFVFISTGKQNSEDISSKDEEIE